MDKVTNLSSLETRKRRKEAKNRVFYKHYTLRYLFI